MSNILCTANDGNTIVDVDLNAIIMHKRDKAWSKRGSRPVTTAAWNNRAFFWHSIDHKFHVGQRAASHRPSSPPPPSCSAGTTPLSHHEHPKPAQALQVLLASWLLGFFSGTMAANARVKPTQSSSRRQPLLSPKPLPAALPLPLSVLLTGDACDDGCWRGGGAQ